MNRFAQRLAALLTRRPKLVLVVWVLLVGALAMRGSHVEDELVLHVEPVEGTQSKRVNDLVSREFGNSMTVVVMLRGPRAALDAQGPRLAADLERHGRFVVLSPWSSGAAGDRLRPSPGVAAVVVRADGVDETDALAVLPPVERQIAADVRSPVRANLAGLPQVLESMQAASKEAASGSERIAIPVLLLVLLFVFRSVVASFVPIVAGGLVVAASRGVLSLVGGVAEIDLFVVGVAAMMGLALGVDYSLLVVSRFREARRDGGEPAALLEETIAASTRAILPAGCGLLIAMVAAVVIYPTVMTQSIAIAVATVTVLSVISALVVVPAALALLGDNLDRWALRERDGSRIASLRWSRRLIARPGAVAAICLLLLFLAGWAFSLDSGLASARFLPADSPGRIGQEEVERELGPGWAAPIEVTMNGHGSPVTETQRLRALAAFQHRVKRDPGVEAVVGFAPIERGLRPLGNVDEELAEQQRGLRRLDRGIGRLHRGADLNTEGLLAAAEGARAIHFGVGATNRGSGLLAGGLRAASDGSERLGEGLAQADDGSGELSQGAAKASDGAGRLADGLAKAREGTAEIGGSVRLLENAMRAGEERLAELHEPLDNGAARLDAAWQALQQMTVGRNDPQYQAALQAVAEADLYVTGRDARTGEQADPSYAGVEAGVERAEGQFESGLYLAEQLGKNGDKAAKGIDKLADGSNRLDRGLQRLETGAKRLSRGIGALAEGGETLSPALARLGDGAEALAGGLAQLEGGSGKLADGLGGGAQKSKLLGGGLRRIALALERREGGADLDLLRKQSPGLFDSGYFKLAALDGGRPERRRQLGFLINLDRGGDVARMLIVPRGEALDPETLDTKQRIEGDADRLAAATGAEVAVGGLMPSLIDVDRAERAQAPWVRLALSLVSFLVLLPVVRSLTIPLLAALLNLLTVTACFGVLALAFDGSLLGGPGYIDTVVLYLAMIVMFGLAIDYEVFVFSRMREEYVRTGSPIAALENGLDRTAHVVTGAAAIMIAVFLSFSVTDLMTLRNFGVAQAVGIFIDAFLIRLIVFPALLRRLGRWAWWMPAWLDRLLPGGEPPPAPAKPAPEQATA